MDISVVSRFSPQSYNNIRAFQSSMDHIYGGGPTDYNGAENFLSHSDIMALVKL